MIKSEDWRGNQPVPFRNRLTPSFADGNKGKAAALFLWFLEKNRLLYRADGAKRLADNALVALTLMIAESAPPDKDLVVRLVVNLINKEN